MTFLKIKIIDDLKDKYEGEIYHFSNTEDWKINVFIYKSNAENIEKNWRKISSSISVYYQSELVKAENEFEKWNFYILFVTEDGVSKELKNLIETNKFSSRKIVEDYYLDSISETSANNLITKHIVNDDLVSLLSDNNKVKNSYNPKNIVLWDKIPLENIKGDTSMQNSIINEIKLIIDEN